jgi:hypothetical protein
MGFSCIDTGFPDIKGRIDATLIVSLIISGMWRYEECYLKCPKRVS